MESESPLDNLVLSFPCPVSWESMDGNERERLCRQCSKKVYNISDLSKKDAEKLLKVNDGKKMCYTFFVRQDGTIKTDNCPSILRPVREKFRSLQKACSIAMAFLFSISAGLAKDSGQTNSNKNQSQVPPEFTRTAGIIALPEFHDQAAALFLFDGEQAKPDAFLKTYKTHFETYRSLSLEQLKEIEDYFHKNGMKTKEFLARQAQVQVNLDRYGTNSKNDSQKESLEIERQKLVKESLATARKNLADKNHDQAVCELNTTLVLSTNPYRSEELSGKRPQGVSKWQLSCGGTKKSLLMSSETKKAMIDILSKTVPSHQAEKDLKKNLLDGLNGAIITK
ncbi:MAG: hypothetical protein KIT34_11565 [Cyanobacteria bacterium TGS_CYA1]|nr:hypothetical protein [Cyanobacteria bacterium TGS_CYA1]